MEPPACLSPSFVSISLPLLRERKYDGGVGLRKFSPDSYIQ